MRGDLWFRNARLVLAGEVLPGDLYVRGGQIRALGAAPGGAAPAVQTPGTGTASDAPATAIDCEGDYLLPGLVEIHTDNFERHLMPRPKVQWPVLPALLAHDAEVVAAGITTVFDALGVGEADLDTLRGSPWNEVLEALAFAADGGLLRAEHHLHVRCELPAPNTIDLFAPFRGHPRLSLVSLMDHTPGQRQWEDLSHARTYYTGKKGWSLEKFERQVAQAAELQARNAAPNRAFFVDWCRAHAIALASHDDTTLAHVEQAHAEGAVIAEFPTTRLAAAAARARGMRTVMGGPNVVRGGSHSGNVAAAELARAGLLDILSSDYVPGSLLGGVMRLVDDGLLDLPAAVATVSATPAQATGLHDRGRLAPGLRADLLRVRLVDLPQGGRQAVVRAVWRAGERVL